MKCWIGSHCVRLQELIDFVSPPPSPPPPPPYPRRWASSILRNEIAENVNPHHHVYKYIDRNIFVCLFAAVCLFGYLCEPIGSLNGNIKDTEVLLVWPPDRRNVQEPVKFRFGTIRDNFLNPRVGI